ncbi:MAG: hypothetical protein GWO44_21605 [Thermoplasmata archaeon]|nr:hypothetical protein [Thermoplasmata archaeon]NIY05781.1 hypothetical protein [Thermoplasmata archaeon]
MSSTDARLIGKRYVVDWLESMEFEIVDWDDEDPEALDIEAEHSEAHMIVRVKTVVEPDEPEDLSAVEVRDLMSKASERKAVAWEAKVRLDEDRLLKGDISWKIL